MLQLIENSYQLLEVTMAFLKSIGYFILAGLFEIGGGYLIWLWLREGKGITYAVLGAIILVCTALSQLYNLLTLGESMPHTVEYL